MLIWRFDLPVYYLRNFLFVGIPYFSLGVLFKKNSNALISNKYLYLVCFLIFVLTSYIERDIITFFNVQTSRNHYISTTFLAISLFLFFVSAKIDTPRSLIRMGQTDTLYLYIYHPIILTCSAVITLKLGIYEAYSYITPLCCLVFTVLLIKVFRFLRIID